jgi:hypothetical protein
MREESMRRFGALLTVVALIGLVGPAARGTDGSDERGRAMSYKRSVWWASWDSGRAPGSISNVECRAGGGPTDIKLDCDDPFPNNEPDVEVDPTDPMHAIASSNDYGTCCDQFYTTFNGGQSWITGNMSNEGPTRIGSDPVTVFDVKHDVALHTSLNFRIDGFQACDGDLVVSRSKNGGVTWTSPIVIFGGHGCDQSGTQVFNDKEWIVVDNNPDSLYYGRAYVTWSAFVSHNGVYASSAIYQSHSSDGGRTWSPAQVISGSNANLCTYQETGPAGQCDEDQFSVPTVMPDGTVGVAFQNSQNQALWEQGELFDDQYLVVTSGDGGRTWQSPRFVVGLEDGSRDYPINVNGRQTLSGYQTRVNSAGNVVADPATGDLFLVFSDNRAGAHDVNSPVSNTNVYLMTSRNGGSSWSGPVAVDTRGQDQWFPWVEIDPSTGGLGVLYHSRRVADADLYDTILSQGEAGSWTRTKMDGAPSDPVHSEYFQAGVAGCQECATFIGDYIGLSYGSDGSAYAVWTDMRDVAGDGLRLQFVYGSRI